MTLSAHVRITLFNPELDAPGAFGSGCASLLEGVIEEGSLNKAAQRMGMAYSKAWRIIKEAEVQLGFDLLERNGAHGSMLTSNGKRMLNFYRELQADVKAAVDKKLPEL